MAGGWTAATSAWWAYSPSPGPSRFARARRSAPARSRRDRAGRPELRALHKTSATSPSARGAPAGALHIVGQVVVSPEITNEQVPLGSGGVMTLAGAGALSRTPLPRNVFLVQLRKPSDQAAIARLKQQFPGVVLPAVPPPEVRDLRGVNALPARSRAPAGAARHRHGRSHAHHLGASPGTRTRHPQGARIRAQAGTGDRGLASDRHRRKQPDHRPAARHSSRPLGLDAPCHSVRDRARPGHYPAGAVS